jgi:hypothetical protein
LLISIHWHASRQVPLPRFNAVHGYWFHRYAGHRFRHEKPAADLERKSALQVLSPVSLIEKRRFLMRSKLAISALVVASLFGATAIASAQTQPAPGASSEGNVGPGATGTKMKSGKMVKSSKTKSGATTGMSSGKSSMHNPSGQGNVSPGTGNDAGAK